MSDATQKRARLPIPPWAWLFVAGCLGIILATSGGVVPIAIALLGAVGVYYAATSPGRSAAARAGLSVAVVLLAWVILWAWAVVVVVLLHDLGA